jgi:hypothetical protein
LIFFAIGRGWLREEWREGDVSGGGERERGDAVERSVLLSSRG